MARRLRRISKGTVLLSQLPSPDRYRDQREGRARPRRGGCGAPALVAGDIPLRRRCGARRCRPAGRRAYRMPVRAWARNFRDADPDVNGTTYHRAAATPSCFYRQCARTGAPMISKAQAAGRQLHYPPGRTAPAPRLPVPHAQANACSEEGELLGRVQSPPWPHASRGPRDWLSDGSALSVGPRFEGPGANSPFRGLKS